MRSRLGIGVRGILGIAAGLIAFFWAGITALALLIVIAVWLVGSYAIVFGIGMLARAWRLRRLLEHMPEAPSRAPQTRPA